MDNNLPLILYSIVYYSILMIRQAVRPAGNTSAASIKKDQTCYGNINHNQKGGENCAKC